MKSTLHKSKQPSHFSLLPLVALALVLLAVAIATPARAAGLLKPIQGDQNHIQIKEHHVNVVLNNGFARTEVDQVFANTGSTDLEAVYSFPVPKQASMSEVSLWIDGKEIVGEVLEKKAARQVYEEQKSQGKDTALVTKDSYKTFEVNVAPVRANQHTRVRLVYYQPLEIDLNIGRYVYPLAEGNVDEERIAFWSVDDKIQSTFSFDLTLKSAFPVKDIRMPGFQNDMVISRETTEEQTGIHRVSLNYNEGANLSRDIVFYYRLDDTTPARVELIPYRQAAQKQGTFMLVVTPGASLQRIAEGTDWTFVLDTSGSMDGAKIKLLIDGVSKVIGKLSPLDRFRVVTFAEIAHDFTGGFITATPEHVNQTLAQIQTIQAGGGTALYEGLASAYDGLDNDRTTAIVLVTDGVANIGPSKHADLMRLHRQHDVRLFTFVMGNSANQPLLDALAKESGGFAMNISSNDDIIGRIIQAKTKMMHQAISDTRLKIRGERVKDLTPTSFGNIFAGQQVVMFGHYTGEGPVEIELSGNIEGARQRWTCKTSLPAVDEDNPEIERLWALSHIEEIMDDIRNNGETNRSKKAVIDTALEYSLVTDYTAMVVVQDEMMENMGIQKRNADRVARERAAQARRAPMASKNYRVDRPSPSSGKDGSGSTVFKSPLKGIGSGPVGPLFVGLALWMKRRKKPANG